MKNKTLLIFIKNPELGKAKTRIANTLGDEKALAIYRQLLTYTRMVAVEVNAHKQLYYSSYIDVQDEWQTPDFEKFEQKGKDLGERMAHAFLSAFEQGAKKVVIIGSDCGELSPADIEEAFLMLDEVPVVFGPARDGGYYLLGMNKFEPSVFRKMPWSQPNLLRITLAVLVAGGVDYRLLKMLNDVDRERDWMEVKERVRRAIGE